MIKNEEKSGMDPIEEDEVESIQSWSFSLPFEEEKMDLKKKEVVRLKPTFDSLSPCDLFV